jgi:hypothetical protein
VEESNQAKLSKCHSWVSKDNNNAKHEDNLLFINKIVKFNYRELMGVELAMLFIGTIQMKQECSL